jgi:hypothetical protein
MQVHVIILIFTILYSAISGANTVDLSGLINNLTVLRAQSRPLLEQLEQLRTESVSNQEQLKWTQQELNQFTIDNKNIQYDFLTQELLISNYQEKHNLYVELLAQLAVEKVESESSQELLQQQLEDAKARYDELLVEVDSRKQVYLAELAQCQTKRTQCFENTTVKRFQNAWNTTSDQLNVQTELISDLGQLYHQNMSKLAKLKSDELQYQESVKQYKQILSQHQQLFSNLTLKKQEVNANLNSVQTRLTALTERETLLNSSLISLQEQVQANQIAVVNLEAELSLIQKKMNRDYKIFAKQIPNIVTHILSVNKLRELVKSFEADLKTHLLETSKKLVIVQRSQLLQASPDQIVTESAKVLLQNDIEPILVESLQTKIIDMMIESNPTSIEIVMAFKTQIQDQIKNLKDVSQLQYQLKTALVERLVNLGQLIVREGENAISENLEQRMGQVN